MGYINQDIPGHDLVVPFAGKQVVDKTAAAWNTACWCGETAGQCDMCESQAMLGKIHIGSGEDADSFR